MLEWQENDMILRCYECGTFHAAVTRNAHDNAWQVDIYFDHPRLSYRGARIKQIHSTEWSVDQTFRDDLMKIMQDYVEDVDRRK